MVRHTHTHTHWKQTSYAVRKKERKGLDWALIISRLQHGLASTHRLKKEKKKTGQQWQRMEMTAVHGRGKGRLRIIVINRSKRSGFPFSFLLLLFLPIRHNVVEQWSAICTQYWPVDVDGSSCEMLRSWVKKKSAAASAVAFCLVEAVQTHSLCMQIMIPRKKSSLLLCVD